MMIDRITFPVPKNENQKKLFEEVKKYANYYDLSLKDESIEWKSGWRHQAYGMIVLYTALFPEESEQINDLWMDEILPYFSR